MLDLKLLEGESAMKKLGIGYENYKEFVDQKLYYVDKTLLARDIVEKGGKVTLFTRPRRFGKTLALSMIQTFFEAETDRKGNSIDNSHYFQGDEDNGLWGGNSLQNGKISRN